MAQYQNIFTQIQVRSPAELGVELPRGDSERQGVPYFNHLFGRFGDLAGGLFGGENHCELIAGDTRHGIERTHDAGNAARNVHSAR